MQRVLPQYRVQFFQRLAERLGSDGIRLELFYGQEQPGTVPTTVATTAPWAHRIHNVYWTSGSRSPVWQPCLTRLTRSGLIIVEQANRLLINYLLFAARWFLPIRLAYWGHGRNMQALGRNHIREHFKNRLVGAVDWWFAYTRLSQEHVVSTGFPRGRVTLVQNSVDTSDLEAAAQTVSPDDLAALRAQLGIKSNRVGIFCGGMYAEKKLDFLLAACREIRMRLTDFEMIFIGSGPRQAVVEKAASVFPWIHYLGPKHGSDRVPYFMLSQVMLMPGMVGLTIIDSFAAGTPLFTTNLPLHSPEIAYLQHGFNGVMTPYCVSDYVSAVVSAFKSQSKLRSLRTGCLKSASKYNLDQMVENFAEGVVRCISRPPARLPL